LLIRIFTRSSNLMPVAALQNLIHNIGTNAPYSDL
jgi:hypothetical protein